MADLIAPECDALSTLSRVACQEDLLLGNGQE